MRRDLPGVGVLWLVLTVVTAHPYDCGMTPAGRARVPTHPGVAPHPPAGPEPAVRRTGALP